MKITSSLVPSETKPAHQAATPPVRPFRALLGSQAGSGRAGAVAVGSAALAPLGPDLGVANRGRTFGFDELGVLADWGEPAAAGAGTPAPASDPVRGTAGAQMATIEPDQAAPGSGVAAALAPLQGAAPGAASEEAPMQFAQPSSTGSTSPLIGQGAVGALAPPDNEAGDERPAAGAASRARPIAQPVGGSGPRLTLMGADGALQIAAAAPGLSVAEAGRLREAMTRTAAAFGVEIKELRVNGQDDRGGSVHAPGGVHGDRAR